VAPEQAPAAAVPGTVGEAEVGLDELRACRRIDLVFGVGVVEPCGHPPAFVEPVMQAVGADPLGAPLRAAVAPPFQLALPVRPRGGPAAADADGLAVHLSAEAVGQLPVAERESGVPAHRAEEIHPEGVRQAGFAARFEELALVEQVHLVRQPPALPERPAVAGVGIEPRVDPGMEEALYEMPVMRRFARLGGLDSIPDETTILN